MNLFVLGAWDWVWETINGLMLTICDVIYYFVTCLYQVFDAVARVNLFSEDIFDKLTGRIYLVMGIAMLFIFAYNIILSIVNPDDKNNTGRTTKMVKETIISLVLIILLPTIFNWMTIFQNNVLDSQIIGRIIMGDMAPEAVDNCSEYADYEPLKKYMLDDFGFDETTEVNILLSQMCQYYYNLPMAKQGAYLIPSLLMQTFYYPLNFKMDECIDYLAGDDDAIADTISEDDVAEDEEQICANYFYDVMSSKYLGDVSSFVLDDYLRSVVSDSDKDSLEFQWLMAIVAGVFALIMFFCYAMEIGVRVAKLGILQLISPITVMMRIIPGKKESIYDKWQSMLISTYVDVFLRLTIIYFALFAISLVPTVIDTLIANLASTNASWLVTGVSSVFVILGILRFGQEAPGLLKEFFGGNGKFAIRSPKKQLAESKIANAALRGGINAFRGGMYGATTGKGLGRIGGFFSGAARGAVGGYDKAVSGLDTARTERENGSTFGGRMLDRARVAIGMETRAESDDRRIEKVFNTENRRKQNEDVLAKVKAIRSHLEGEIDKDTSKYMYTIRGVDGKDFTGNYSQMQDYLNMLQERIGSAKTDAERARAFRNYQDFKSNLMTQKKESINNSINEFIAGRNVDGFSATTADTIRSMVEEINAEVAKGGVGLQYSDSGKIAQAAYKETVTTAEQLFGGKDSSGKEIAGLKAILEDQANEIRKHSLPTQNKLDGYSARHADSRMARGHGKSEKK